MEHAVLVYLRLSDGAFGSDDQRARILELEERMEAAINNAGVGEFDGDEFGMGECTLFMYGPDADQLFATVKPLLESSPDARRGYAIKRYGDAADLEAKEVRVEW